MKVSLVSTVFALITVSVISASKTEVALLKQLFSGDRYDKKERPAKVDRDTVNIDFLVYLRQVIDVDEKLQKILSNLWLSLSWNDYRLIWDPKKHNNITILMVPIDIIWRPDILLENSATEDFDPTNKVNALLHPNGLVEWTPPGIFSSTCPMEIKYFPFDIQHCKLKFSSWAYDMARINLTLTSKEADTSSYVPNGEWDLIRAPAVRNEDQYKCCPEIFVDATITIIIARRPLYYLFNLVLPTFLISIIALLTFILPVESGEKVTLSVMILLSICVFLLLAMEQLPPTSDAVPLLGWYFACSTMLLSVSVATTIVVLNLHFRSPAISTMPRWIQRFVNGHLAYVLRMKRPEPEENVQAKRRPTICVRRDLAMMLSPTLLLSPIDEESSAFPFAPTSPNVQWQMRQVVRELRTVTRKMEKADEDQDVCEEWKFAASVIDRLCFLLFGLMILALTFVTLFAGPDPSSA